MRSIAAARIRVAVQALTGSSLSDSLPPIMSAMNQMTSQTNVIRAPPSCGFEDETCKPSIAHLRAASDDRKLCYKNHMPRYRLDDLIEYSLTRRGRENVSLALIAAACIAGIVAIGHSE